MKLLKIISSFSALLFVLLVVGCSDSEEKSLSSTAQSADSSGSSADIIPSSADPSAASASVPAFIHIDFATDELVNKYSSVNEFIEFKDPGYQKILLTTDRKLTNFKFIEIDYTEENYHLKYYEKSVLYTTSEFSPEKPFVVTWMEFGDIIPYRGISYVDENNITKKYYFKQSGKDGSLHLFEF